jgi:ABC-2 type transport system ATP-binding protein
MIIEATGLRKSFTRRAGREREVVEAVADVDLTVKEGEIFGFLGPNGAGKTTTLRMLTTLLQPDGGTAFVAGADLLRDPAAVRRRVGYVAQRGGLVGQVSARAELVLQARVHGYSKTVAQERTARVLDTFEITPFADRPSMTYSGGQRRRVEIALGVIHDPALVFLDEPSTGLDPQSRARLWDEIARLRELGTTVFLTTHYLDEADALCDRIAIIDGGRVVAVGSPEEFKREIAGEVITVSIAEQSDRVLAVLSAVPCVRRAEPIEGGVRLAVDDAAAAIPVIFRRLDEELLRVASVELHRPSLDDVFLEKTGRSLRES